MGHEFEARQDSRYTFISALGEIGVPVPTIKELAGRISAKMLERYSHTRNRAKSDAVGQLPTRKPASSTLLSIPVT
jgi:hypothetical protein